MSAIKHPARKGVRTARAQRPELPARPLSLRSLGIPRAVTMALLAAAASLALTSAGLAQVNDPIPEEPRGDPDGTRMRTYQFHSRATLKVRIDSPPLGEMVLDFSARDPNGNGDTTVDVPVGPYEANEPIETALTSIDLYANDPVLGDVFLRLRHDIVSEGTVYNNANGLPTTDRPADANFLVYVELEVPRIASLFDTGQHAVEMVAEGVRGFPPYGSEFHTITESVPLYDTSDPTVEVGEVIDVIHIVDCGVSLPGPCNDQDDPGCGDSDCCTQNTCEIEDGFPVCVVNPAPAGHYPEGCGESVEGECNEADDEGCGDSDCCTNNECHCDGEGNAMCVIVEAPPGTEGCGACCTAGGCEASGEDDCDGTFLEGECSETTGACCMGDGSCVETTQECCDADGGSFSEGGDCAETGACCMGDGSCVETTEQCCQEQGGNFYDGDCAETGACCMGDGSCVETTEQCCQDQGGTFYDGDCSDTGACCMPDGSCEELIEPCCEDAGGTFYDGDCSDTGACCLPDGSCEELVEPCCEDAGGTFYAQYDCESTGACCLPDGKCEDLPEPCCQEIGGTFYAQYDCEYTGACCLPDGSCEELVEPCCEDAGGTFYEQYDCYPEYACCLPDGECIITSYPCCEDQGGQFHEGEYYCYPEGACCLYEGGCIETTPDCCADTGGTYMGDGVPCEPDPCCTVELSPGATEICVGDQTQATAFGWPPGGFCTWTATYSGEGRVSIVSGGTGNCTAYITGTVGSSAVDDVRVIVNYFPPAGDPCATSFDLTVYDPDIDIDSDNDGNIAEADDPIETDAPGKFLQVNHSDDDDDDVLDLYDPVVPGEPDIEPLQIESTVCDAGDRWRVVYPSSRVFVYNNPNIAGSAIVFSGVWNPCPIPDTLYIEGRAGSAARGDVNVAFELDLDGDNNAECADNVVATVVTVDLDVDSDNTKACGATTPDRSTAEDVIETDDPDDPGRFVIVNDDFDEGHTAPDPCQVPFTGCDRVADNDDADPISADGTTLETDDFVAFVPEILIDTPAMLADVEIRIRPAAGAGAVRVIAIDPAASAPFAGDWIEVPFDTDLRADYFTQGGTYHGWNWFAEGMTAGEVELELEFKFNETVLDDKVELAVTRVELIRNGANETALKDWPEEPAENLLRSARYPFDDDDEVLVRFTSVAGLGDDYFSANMTSDSDGTGVRVMLKESGAGVYVNNAAEVLRLEEASSAGAPKTLQVIDEEIMTADYRLEDGAVDIFCDQDVMVDRLEGAGGGINAFYGAAGGDQSQLQTDMWGASNFYNSGDQDVPHTPAGSATLRTFIRNAGANNPGSLETDLLWISSHGCEDGNLSNNGPAPTEVFDPNGANGFVAGNWDTDIDWTTIAACLWLNEGDDCAHFGGGCFAAPPASFGRQEWQSVVFRDPRSVHGLLGAWCALDGNLQAQVSFFFTQLRAGRPFLDAYGDAMAGGGPTAQPWASLYIDELDYQFDTMLEIHPDIAGSNQPSVAYVHIVGVAGIVCGRAPADQPTADQQAADPDQETPSRTDKSGPPAFAGVDLEAINRAPGELPSVLTFQVVTPTVDDPGFEIKHRVESPNGTVLYDSGRGFAGATGASRLSEVEALALGDTWLRQNLPAYADNLTNRGVYPVKSGKMDRRGEKGAERTVGYVVDYDQAAGGVTVHGQYVRLNIVGDRVAAATVKLVDVVGLDDVKPRIAPETAFDAVRDQVNVGMNLAPGDDAVARAADLRYWTGLSFTRAVDKTEQKLGKLVYHYVAVSAANCDENGCSRESYDVAIDAVSGELISVNKR